MAKLQIFHHNGQLAEFETDLVTGLHVVGEGFEDVNAFLHKLIDKPGVAPIVVPDPVPAPEAPVPVPEPDPTVVPPVVVTVDPAPTVEPVEAPVADTPPAPETPAV